MGIKMKFTNGYWLMRKEIEPIYAVEYGYHKVREGQLTVYVSTKAVTGRADTVNLPMLTVTLSSPIENVIKVTVEHFKGQLEEGPRIQINKINRQVQIEESEGYLSYQSGSLSAKITKESKSWRVAFYEENTLLTESSYRNMAHMTNQKTGKTYMVEQLAIDVDEYLYGFGERFTPFVKNGQSIDMWNEDGGTSSEQTYKNIPFYLSNKGYGVLVDNLGDVSFEIASEKVERAQFSVEGEKLSYYIISGKTPKKTLELYTLLTGRPALPPAWSFGLWLTTSFSTDYNESIVSNFIKGMEDRNIPLHVFHFDCFWMRALEWCNLKWNQDLFGNPKSMLDRFHKRGLKVSLWINPYVAQNSDLFEEGMKKGYFIKKTDGSVWQTDMWQSGMAIIDFTNPDATKWYQDKLRILSKMGVDSFKTDFGERIPVVGIMYYDHSDPVKMHNYYSILYNKAVFEVVEETKGKGKATLFARAATVGGQQYPVHWGGDCSATYPSMAETLRGGLSLSTCGFGFWSHDISGFEQTATPDIYKRWCAFGLLSSHSRLHGGVSYRVPWLFDEESCDVLRKFVALKCSLMPYLYGQAVISHEQGIPMHRPMFMEFAGDRSCETLDKEYMLGESLLVAPIFKEDGSVEYYLPEGKWTHLLSEQIVDGGKWKKEKYDYFSLPLWVKEGTILPIGKEKTKVEYDYTDGVKLCLSEFSNNRESSVIIPDLDGNKAVAVTAKREENKITVELDKELSDWEVLTLGRASKLLQKDSRKAVIELT